MSLTPGDYILTCWNSTINPSELKHSHVAFQTHKLIKALRPRLTSGEIIIPSRDRKTTRKGIELCVMAEASKLLPSTQMLKTLLIEEPAKLALDYKNFQLQDDSLTVKLDAVALANIADLNKPIDADLTEADFEVLEKSASEFKGFHAGDTWASSVPKEKMSQPFMLMRNTLDKLRNAEGDDLKREMQGILNGMKVVSETPKTSWQTILGIISGIVAVGGYIKAIPGVWAGVKVCLEFVAGVCASLTVAGVIAAFAIVIAVLGTIFGLLYVLFKDARNVLLVVNDTSSDVKPIKQDIYSGEIKLGTNYLPRGKPSRPWVWAGWYVWDRMTGFYGTTVGVVFQNSGTDVAIGLDCPNTAGGGRNAVSLQVGSDAAGAQSQARGCADKSREVGFPGAKCTARIADSWGNVNWACMVFSGH
ncbi:hypothetical protein GGR52DRAFT_143842 [Hypoxylon sp. FL1284]|nr:hypothetical protein GGR52DRAFT_143842 [Hypoxylon sp. FL1284]